MILRNSATSILRTPFKTVLFALLITAVTAFLYLGVNTWASSVRMLKECDETFTTIAVIEYIGTSYPDESVHDEAMLAEVNGIDCAAIAENENVLSWNPTDCSIGTVEGFTAHSSLVPYSNKCVLTVTEVHELQDAGVYYGKVIESPYCYRTDVTGKHIYIYPDGEDFDPDPKAYYVLHGQIEDLSTMVMSVHFRSFYSRAATLAGVDCDAVAPCVQIAAPEDTYTTHDGLYASIADFYQVMNNRIYLQRTDAVEDREEFHQNWVQIIDGRLFTEQEQAEEANVCIITETIANSCGLSVGDVMPVRYAGEGGKPAADCYWGAGSLTESGSYEIVGIVNYYDGLQYNVYIPGHAQSVEPERYIYILGQATLKNGTAEAFTDAIEPLLPARATLSIYDQGYQNTADSLFIIQKASVLLTATATAAALLILLCFAHLFVEKQRGTVETMRCFGMKKADVRLYLLFGAALIAAVACTLGALIGTRYAGALIANVYDYISELQALDLRYSSGYLGLTKTYEPIPLASAWLAVLVAAIVFLLALVLCLYNARRTIEGRVMKKRSRTQNLRPPKRSSAIGGGALRYSLLSIWRGGVRTLIVPVVSMAMLLFITTLLSASASYAEARESLCDTTEIRGSLVTMRGKYAGNLVVRNKYVQQIIDSGYIDDAAITYHKNYRYLGVTEYADGAPGDAEDVPWPDNVFTLEKMLEQLSAAPQAVFTNDASDAPEFHFSALQAQFMDGYDESSFAQNDWSQLFGIVSEQFLTENGLSYGDCIRIYVVNGTGYSADDVDLMPFIGLEMKIVGSFYRQGGDDNIYCPLPDRIMDLDGLAAGEEADTSRYFVFGVLRKRSGEYDLDDMQNVLNMLLGESNVASMSFSLKDSRQLGAFKDYLEEQGFSGPNQQRNIRVALLLDDYDFMRSLSNISQRSKYMEILYPVLLALSCAVGLITASLMAHARRDEIATMRGMGARRSRIFASFFSEQAILLVIGLLAGAAAWLAIGDAAFLRTPEPYGFAVSYLAGSTLTLLWLNSRKALDVLSEKE